MDNQLEGSYMTILPFVGTSVGDVLLFSERDDDFLIFNKKIFSEGVDSINVYSNENRAFLRKLGGSINYESVVEDGYKVKISNKLIDKYNLKEGYILQEEGNHLVCRGLDNEKKKTR